MLGRAETDGKPVGIELGCEEIEGCKLPRSEGAVLIEGPREGWRLGFVETEGKSVGIAIGPDDDEGWMVGMLDGNADTEGGKLPCIVGAAVVVG